MRNFLLLIQVALNTVSVLAMATLTMAFMSFVILRTKWRDLLSGVKSK